MQRSAVILRALKRRWPSRLLIAPLSKECTSRASSPQSPTQKPSSSRPLSPSQPRASKLCKHRRLERPTFLKWVLAARGKAPTLELSKVNLKLSHVVLSSETKPTCKLKLRIVMYKRRRGSCSCLSNIAYSPSSQTGNITLSNRMLVEEFKRA
jgi:hypothetical protein